MGRACLWQDWIAGDYLHQHLHEFTLSATQPHAILAFALLEAIRAADIVPDGMDLGDIGEDGAVRLGRSQTIMRQIARYQRMARRGGRVAAAELAGLLRLLARRADASLVFAEAGRRAGRCAAYWEVSRTGRLLAGTAPRLTRHRLGYAVVRRAADSVLDVAILPDRSVVWRDSAEVGAGGTEVKTCDVYGSATAELLRRFTDFDGALFHTACRSHGDQTCAWSMDPDNGGI